MSASVQSFSKSDPSTSHDIGNAMKEHPLGPAHDHHEKIYTRLDWIVDPNNPLRDINESHCRALAELFHNYNFYYAHGKMMVYFTSTINMEGVIYATAMQTVDSMKGLNDIFCIVVLDGRHECRIAEMLPKEDRLERALDQTRMGYTFFVDCVAI